MSSKALNDDAVALHHQLVIFEVLADLEHGRVFAAGPSDAASASAMRDLALRPDRRPEEVATCRSCGRAAHRLRGSWRSPAPWRCRQWPARSRPVRPASHRATWFRCRRRPARSRAPAAIQRSSAAQIADRSHRGMSCRSAERRQSSRRRVIGQRSRRRLLPPAAAAPARLRPARRRPTAPKSGWRITGVEIRAAGLVVPFDLDTLAGFDVAASVPVTSATRRVSVVNSIAFRKATSFGPSCGCSSKSSSPRVHGRIGASA